MDIISQATKRKETNLLSDVLCFMTVRQLMCETADDAGEPPQKKILRPESRSCAL